MKKLLFLIIFGILLAPAGFFYWQNSILPVNSKDQSTEIFVIKPGDSLSTIAANLAQKKLIKNPWCFKILVSYLGLAQKIQAGDFRLSSSMKAKTIAETLTHGTLDVWVTIPEGLRAEEVTKIINSKFPTSPDLVVIRGASKTQNSKFIDLARDNEGFLFPDTYLIPKETDSQAIIDLMINNFNRKMEILINLEKAKKGEITINNLSLNELITLASLIEREAKDDADRSLVASVIYNRLKAGMKLDIDATIQYAVAETECQVSDISCDWWLKTLSAEDLKTDSFYNTYIYSGLPPKPICNPGLASIKAALKPTTTDFLYYVSDHSGQIHYAKSLEEQNENISKYLTN